MDTGYENYQDQRLAYPPDVHDRDEPEDEPLTAALREELDRAGIRYTVGWLLAGEHRVNERNVTTIEVDGCIVSVEEYRERMYMETDGGLKLDAVVAMLRAGCGK